MARSRPGGDPGDMENTAETQPKKLRRSSSNRLVAGVCGGLGDYFGLSPTIYRIAFAVLVLLGLAAAVAVQWWVVLVVGAILLGLLALGAIGLGLLGVALAVVGGAIAVALVVGFSFNGGVGDRTARPATAADLKRYELGVGHLRVDLHALSLPAGDTQLR